MRKMAYLVAALISLSAVAQNTIKIYKKDGSKIEYNVSELDSVVFDKAVTETPVDPVDPADPERPGTIEGEVVTTGDVQITRSAGWFESGFAEWTPVTNASGYNVYCKPKTETTYKQIDAMLVRSYGTYLRADVVGLAPGSYDIKVVATKDGKEFGNASVAEVSVESFSRQGFAFAKSSGTGGTGVGAYNDNGTLKSDAVVLYLTEKSKKVVTMDVITSSKGGKTTCVGISEILTALQKGYETRPICIRIVGLVTIDGINGSGDINNLLVKSGSKDRTVNNITIEGIGEDATCYGWGIRALRVSNFEVRNLAVMLFGDDGLSFEGVNSNIWVHHNDIFYGKPGSDEDQVKGDGSLDLKDDSRYMTLSYNHFFDSGKMSLCGMKDETGANYISYDHNWFDHSDSRHPRIRRMSVHVWNNYFDGNAKYGVGMTYGGSAFVEANYYRNCPKPMLVSMQGTDALGEGTFSGETGGIIKSFNNIFAEKSSKFSYITYQQNPESFDAYEAKSRDEKVPESIKCVSGGTNYDNFDIDASKMFSYSPNAPEDVPAIVTKNAGRMNGGDFKWKFDNAAEDGSYKINADLKDAITNYKTKLKSILGE